MENFSKRAGIKHDGVSMTLGELHPSAFGVIKLPGLVNNSRYVLYIFFSAAVGFMSFPNGD